jgi:regulator of protease activity HflC (stomatin/prohibitin superfamily)
VTYALGTNYPYYAVIDEKIRYRTEGERAWLAAEERVVKRVGGDPYGDFMAGPGIVLTGCDHAVVVSSGTHFKGAKGPGAVFLGYADAPTQAVDLRPHLRAFPVEAWTKDGIAVKVLTFVPFQIETGNEIPALGKGYPYHSSGVYKAVQAQPMVHESASQMPGDVEHRMWYDIPQSKGESILRDLISRYEFDELYAPFELYDDFHKHPRARIATALQEALDEELVERGIKRVGGGIGNIEPVDDDVTAQRVKAWKTEWMREIMQRQARGQSTRLRLVEQARAQAQTDIILDIGNRMRQVQDSGGDMRLDEVLKYFVEVLEQLAGKNELRLLLPGDMGTIIETLRSVAGSSETTHKEAE